MLAQPLLSMRITIARQRYYARATAYAQHYATTLYGDSHLHKLAFNSAYERGLRLYFADHPAPYSTKRG